MPLWAGEGFAEFISGELSAFDKVTVIDNIVTGKIPRIIQEYTNDLIYK